MITTPERCAHCGAGIGRHYTFPQTLCRYCCESTMGYFCKKVEDLQKQCDALETHVDEMILDV